MDPDETYPNPNSSDLPLVLTVPEVARALRISKGAAYQAVQLGVIPSVRIGRTVRVPRQALLALLDAQPAGGAPRPVPGH